MLKMPLNIEWACGHTAHIASGGEVGDYCNQCTPEERAPWTYEYTVGFTEGYRDGVITGIETVCKAEGLVTSDYIQDDGR